MSVKFTFYTRKSNSTLKNCLGNEMQMISKGKICFLSSPLLLEEQCVIVLIP